MDTYPKEYRNENYKKDWNGKGPIAQTSEAQEKTDNAMSRYDSRSWGAFPQENVIGHSWFVYWPIGRQEGRQPRTRNR